MHVSENLESLQLETVTFWQADSEKNLATVSFAHVADGSSSKENSINGQNCKF